MSRRIVLGCADPALTERVRSVIAEIGDELLRVTTTSSDTLDALAALAPDIVIMADSLGPVPVLDLIRQAARQDPFTGILLLTGSTDRDLYRLAMEAGARSIAPLGFTVDDLGQRIETAANWASMVRAHVANEATRTYGSGYVVALVGSKGGVGTTTLAVHLALQAIADGRRVCLIDFDLLCGDVAALLDITHRRDVVDLVPVVGEMSGQALDDALYRHPSGLHVLLAPRDGERGEDVDESIGRAVLGAVKSRFDVVIVDVGSTLSPAGAAAVQIADRAVLVTTPDVLSVRGARRAVQLWERLQLRRESEVTVLLNKVSRSAEVQPDLAGRLMRLPILDETVPASFRALEASTNTGDPRRLVDRDLRRALARVAGAIGVRTSDRAPTVVSRDAAAPIDLAAAGAAPDAAGGRSRRRSMRRRESTGQTSVEFMGMLPLILIALGLLVQAAVIGYAHVLASNAAAAGARVAVSPLVGYGQIAAAARDELPGAWRRDLQITLDGAAGGGDARYADPDTAVRVTLRAPAVIPLVDSLLDDVMVVTATAQMRFEGR
ncbi:MAG: AAA family ATPase [Kineosporiaceae bacterium]|nr:AAA family ATPase [Kineosporiaceae bacterium]MBK8074589.1 AAA family ATPase [Kineosporiaceae bacterium]